MTLRNEKLAEVARQLLEDAGTQWAAARRALEQDGPSVPSALAETIYTAPKSAAKCEHCGRPTQFFEGCSVIECPMRRPVTAQPSERP